MLFILPLKLFSFLRYLRFCTHFFGHALKRLDNKAKVDFKFIKLQSREKIITIHTLPNVLGSKGNQTIKLVS